MSQRFQRSTAVLSLVAYLLVTTVGGMLHQHEHAADHAVEGRDAHAIAHLNGGHAAAHESDSSGSTPLSDDDCSVCRFLGQPPLAAAAISITVCCGLVAEVSISAPVQAPSRPHSPIHSRAPPQLGELV